MQLIFRFSAPEAVRRMPSGRERSRKRVRPGLAAVVAADQGRRSLRNFSRNRPETTNLNHQYAFRRIFIFSSLMLTVAPARTLVSAEPRDRV